MTEYHTSIKILNTLGTEINFEKVKGLMENIMTFNFVIKRGPYTLISTSLSLSSLQLFLSF